MNNYLMELNRKKEEEIWKVNKSGFLFLIKFGEFSTRRKLYRNPARRENLGTGSDRKKVVPESGTQRKSGNRKQIEAHQIGCVFCVQQKRKSEADNMGKNQTVTDRNDIIILSKEVGKPLIIK